MAGQGKRAGVNLLQREKWKEQLSAGVCGRKPVALMVG